MDTLYLLYLLKIFTGILFVTAIPPAVFLIIIFYNESKRIGESLRFLNAILFISASLGAVALIMSLLITISVLTEQTVSVLNFNIRNLVVAIFFNIPTWGLLWVRYQTSHSKKK